MLVRTSRVFVETVTFQVCFLNSRIKRTYCCDGTKLLKPRSVYMWYLHYTDIFQYLDFKHNVFNAHLLVFVGHLVVGVYPVAVGCGLAQLGTIQELIKKVP